MKGKSKTDLKVVRSPSELTHAFDYVVVTSKAVDQDTVASQLQSATDARTTIVIIQNGVGNEEPFRRLYPDTSIITCVVRRSYSLVIISS